MLSLVGTTLVRLFEAFTLLSLGVFFAAVRSRRDFFAEGGAGRRTTGRLRMESGAASDWCEPLRRARDDEPLAFVELGERRVDGTATDWRKRSR